MNYVRRGAKGGKEGRQKASVENRYSAFYNRGQKGKEKKIFLFGQGVNGWELNVQNTKGEGNRNCISRGGQEFRRSWEEHAKCGERSKRREDGGGDGKTGGSFGVESTCERKGNLHINRERADFRQTTLITRRREEKEWKKTIKATKKGPPRQNGAWDNRKRLEKGGGKKGDLKEPTRGRERRGREKICSRREVG